MAIVPKMLIGVLTVFLMLLVGGVVLQIFLSRRKSRWPGLVLPLLTFCWALLLVLNIRDTGSVSQNVLAVLMALLTGNVPTLVLLAVYWAVREKQRVRDQVEKMRIKDL